MYQKTDQKFCIFDKHIYINNEQYKNYRTEIFLILIISLSITLFICIVISCLVIAWQTAPTWSTMGVPLHTALVYYVIPVFASPSSSTRSSPPPCWYIVPALAGVAAWVGYGRITEKKIKNGESYLSAYNKLELVLNDICFRDNAIVARMNKSCCFVLQYNTEALVLLLQYCSGK